MAMVLSGDLSGSAISSAVALLEAEVADTTNLINAINSFIEDSTTTLKGKSYDAARQKLGLYLADIKSRQSIATELATAISEGAASMAGYMEGYSKLDDAEIDEIEAEIRSLESKISGARQTIYNINQSNENSENLVSVSYYTQQISTWESAIDELKKELDKLVNLEAADSSAFSGVSGACESIVKYSASVEGIKVSSINV